jgi:hypothetical protein
MKYILRNGQFVLVILLHIITIVILLALLSKYPAYKPKIVNGELYGLKKNDYEKIKESLNNKGRISEVSTQKIGSYKSTKQIELDSVSVEFSDSFALEVFDLVQKLENLNESERKKVTEEIETKIKESPEFNEFLQNFSGLLEETIKKNLETEN